MNNVNSLSIVLPAEQAVAPAISSDEMREAVLLVLVGVGFLNHMLLGRDNDSAAADARFEAALGQLLGAANLSPDFFECGPQEHGMNWESVRHTGLASTIQDLYDFAYRGEFDPAYYPGEFNDETGAFWIANILIDLARSSYLYMFSDYSARGEAVAAAKLLQIARRPMPAMS